MMGWGGVGWNVNVHVALMMLRWSWGGVGWDVNVHVTLTMLRPEKSCRFWNNRPTGRCSNMCSSFVYFNTDILGLLAQKPSTARIMGGDPKFKASFSFKFLLTSPTSQYLLVTWWKQKENAPNEKLKKRITAVNHLKHLLSGHATFCPTTVGVVQSARAALALFEKSPRPSSSIIGGSLYVTLCIQKCLEPQAVSMVSLLHCAKVAAATQSCQTFTPKGH